MVLSLSIKVLEDQYKHKETKVYILSLSIQAIGMSSLVPGAGGKEADEAHSRIQDELQTTV